ncbi:MAG: TadE/TadG family type IV pilus assembly protein [Ideonella sp.]|nr:TadE/TadG family type IV pilus assembly protein [Ideonella sp.]
MVEMVFVLPVLLLLTMVLIHHGLLFFAKNQLNHATFMAARAGAVNGGNPDIMERALIDAMVPMYGGGLDDTQLQASRERAQRAVAITKDRVLRGNWRVVTLINPTTASFNDWADPALTIQPGGLRVIPNSGLEYRPVVIGPSSGQTIQDANVLRIRVILAYQPRVPLVMTAYRLVLASQRQLGLPVDPLFAAMVDAGADADGFGGYIPLQAYATLQMQSDALEYP